MVDTFLTNMYGGARADFVYTVTRDFVRNCQTPILVLPDDVPGHPYAVAMETVHLTPNAQVSLYPWKDTPDKIPLAVRHIRTFLCAHDLLQQRHLWQPPPSSTRYSRPHEGASHDCPRASRRATTAMRHHRRSDPGGERDLSRRQSCHTAETTRAADQVLPLHQPGHDR